MRSAFLFPLFLFTFLNIMNMAEAAPGRRPGQQTVCGQISVSDSNVIRLVRRAIYQPGTNGGFGVGRVYRLIQDESGPALDVLRKYEGRFVCIYGIDSCESDDWSLSVSAIAD